MSTLASSLLRDIMKRCLDEMENDNIVIVKRHDNQDDDSVDFEMIKNTSSYIITNIQIDNSVRFDISVQDANLLNTKIALIDRDLFDNAEFDLFEKAKKNILQHLLRREKVLNVEKTYTVYVAV
ncbi:ORF_65 [Adoxophyes orana granulovirus]|uniref:ORF_65 n=1 Tax=Adoxophyes orana granulovirus TaxID=170617 RepID=Q7T9V0_GVAO|nr:ORF_65 [Adoxophyes orana granulovirus]AAP85702.1 ORF_65 [Adoxophyes orana granulovirus]